MHDDAVFPMTTQPDVSGHAQVLAMPEPPIAYVLEHPGVRFEKLDTIADDFMRRTPPPPA